MPSNFSFCPVSFHATFGRPSSYILLPTLSQHLFLTAVTLDDLRTCPFQKHQQWLQTYSRQSKCFWKRRNTAWTFRGEPSSDDAVATTAATAAMRICEDQLASFLVPTVHPTMDLLKFILPPITLAFFFLSLLPHVHVFYHSVNPFKCNGKYTYHPF